MTLVSLFWFVLHVVFLLLGAMAAEKATSQWPGCFFFLSVCCSHQGGNNVGENLSTIIFPQSLQGCNYLPLLKSALRAEHWSPHCSVTREILRKEGMGEK